ncbi:RNase A-like domain-containing protein [Virgibacillus chiguensis]|uniref:RNase A-like domain-containing protein n=1 Tax=Virgibacillus chiguensis TaxID=411959 RepID=UPI003CC7CA52
MAGNVKRKYTNFFEGVMDVVSSVNKAVDDFEKGIVNSIAGMVTGLVTVVKDAGVVAVSGVVPDPVEPSWLKDSADETVDAYTQAAIQFLQDPIRAVESTAQAFTDTVEQEGVMYVTGATFPALIPSSLAVKGASGVAKLGAGAARRTPKLLDSKPFSGNYYRKKIEAAKAEMVKVTEKISFGKDYALSTGGANFILRDKALEDHVNPQLVNMKNGGGGEAKGIDNVKSGDTSSLAPGGGLAAHELKGGHLIERHVGKTDGELLERIRNNPRINGSSTFKDRATAEKVASKVLSDLNNKKAVETWISNPQSKSNLVLTYEGTEVIGRGVKRGSTTVENMTNARIVLKKDGEGNYILTGYPN